MSKRQHGRQRADNCPGSATSSASGWGLPVLHCEAVLSTHSQHKALGEAPADGKNSMTVTPLPRLESLRRWAQNYSSTPHL